MLQDETTTSVTYNESASGVSMGFQTPLGGSKWSLGGGLAYLDDNLYSGSSAMWGSRYMFGADLKHAGASGITYSGMLTGGWGTYQTHRYIAFPSSSVSTSSGTTGYGAVSTPNVSTQGANNITFIGTGLQAERDFYLGRGFHAKPYMAVNGTFVNVGTNVETGGGSLSLVGAPTGNAFLTLQPGFELGGTFTSRNAQLRPHLEVWATHFVGFHEATFTAGLQGAPNYLTLPFTSAIDRTLFDVAPSIDVSGKDGFTLRLSGDFQFSNHLHSGNLSVDLSQQMGPKPR